MKKLLLLIAFASTLVSCVGRSMASYNQEIQAQLPLYDKQNEKVLEDISMPPNAWQLLSTKGGVVNGSAYARTLTAEYSTPDSFRNISLFYSEQLLGTGWQEVSISDDILLFTIDTACVELVDMTSTEGTALPSEDVGTHSMFRITVWHDFFSQPFSIPTPEDINLCAEIFAGACLPCPP